MTVSIADVQDGIKAIVESIGAVASGALVWESEQRPAAQALAILKVVQWDADVDRHAFTADADNPNLYRWSLSTLHYIRVQIRCESTWNAPAKNALATMEWIRAGLRNPALPTPHGILNHEDINTYVHRVDFPHQGRTVSAYSFETNFRAVTDFPLTTPLPGFVNMRSVEVLESSTPALLPTQTISRP